MAREGFGRMAALLSSPDQLSVPQKVCASSQENVVACFAMPATEGSLYMGHSWPIGWRFLAPATDFASMAKHSVCRQSPNVGAPCPNGSAGISVGALGNQRSYHDKSHCLT